MVDIQLQIQNIIKLANITNNQLADIRTFLLQIRKTDKIQISRDIYSISEEVRNIIHTDIEQQAYYIQVLLANELNQCKRKRVKVTDEHIKVL